MENNLPLKLSGSCLRGFTSKLSVIFLLLTLTGYSSLFGQAPLISYTSPQTYAVGLPIAPLSPTNTGGAVPPGNMVSTFAGSGAPGAVNGPKLGASFFNPVGVALDASGNL